MGRGGRKAPRLLSRGVKARKDQAYCEHWEEFWAPQEGEDKDVIVCLSYIWATHILLLSKRHNHSPTTNAIDNERVVVERGKNPVGFCSTFAVVEKPRIYEPHITRLTNKLGTL